MYYLFNTYYLLAILLTAFPLCVLTQLSSKCEQCNPRNFTNILNDFRQECVCGPKEFCNKTLKCATCGDCFNFWDNHLGRAKNEVEILFKEILKGYDIDLNKLKHALSKLKNNYETSKNDSVALEQWQNITYNKIQESNIKISNLKEDFQRLLDLTELLQTKSINVTAITDNIREYRKNITHILDAIKVTTPSNLNVDALKSKAKILSDGVRHLNQLNLQLEKSDYNLALNTEQLLNFMEDIISKYNLNNASLNKNNIDENIKKLNGEILKSFYNVTETIPKKYNVDKLKQDANKTKSQANRIKTDLEKSLRKEQEFHKNLDLLEKNYDFYKQLNRLFKEVNETDLQIKKLSHSSITFTNDLKSAQSEIKGLEKSMMTEYNLYQKDNEKLKMKLKQTQNLDELLGKAYIQQQSINELDENERKSIDQLIEEITKLIAETEACTKKIWKYCQPGLTRKTNP